MKHLFIMTLINIGFGYPKVMFALARVFGRLQVVLVTHADIVGKRTLKAVLKFTRGSA